MKTAYATIHTPQHQPGFVTATFNPPHLNRAHAFQPGARNRQTQSAERAAITSSYPELEAMATTHRKVVKGQALYNAGGRFESLYIVRYGWFKSVLLLENGAEQVTGFQWQGDLLGLDGIGEGQYTTTAIALTDGDVLVIPFRRIAEVSRQNPALAETLSRIMSQEIVRGQQAMMLLGRMNAEQRILAFLLQLSAKLAARGYSATSFMLRMTREEIGRYLGLQIETVSRVMSRLQKLGMLTITDNKNISFNDRSSLVRALSVPDSDWGRRREAYS